MEVLRDMSAFILAGITAIAGVMWGMKRAQISNSFRLEKIEQELRELDLRVKSLEVQGRDGAISLARIQATLDNVLEYLHDLKSELRGKVDK